eukprot:3357925-Alexandrium_andersonii.AAC.1
MSGGRAVIAELLPKISLHPSGGRCRNGGGCAMCVDLGSSASEMDSSLERAGAWRQAVESKAHDFESAW